MASALKILDPNDARHHHTFQQPSKRINDVQDVSHFLQTQAYAEIVTFLFQLNVSVFPRHDSTNNNNNDNDDENGRRRARRWENGSMEEDLPEHIRRLRSLIHRLDAIIDEAPPDTGPRRFGNVSFRKWYSLVEERASTLLVEHLPSEIFSYDDHTKDGQVRAQDEVATYFIASFGSAQRLDYGTGHELSFLAFLATIWKLGGFRLRSDPGEEERGLVLGVIEPYLHLVRRLIKTYTLEPAGSHGVWGLDDYSFLPYIFGSAQFCPAIHSVQDRLPSEGSVDDAPEPADVIKPDIVTRQRRRNMYFDAIAFITDVKRGPFWEHSPILYDISGVRAGWAKINKGMLKMYNAEVLSKFPVVQHFPFGSLFSWDLVPEIKASEQVPTGRVGTVGDAVGTQLATTATTTTPQEVMQQQHSSLPSLNSPSTVLPSSSVSATDMSTSLRQPPSSTSSSVLRPIRFSHVVHSSASVKATSTALYPSHPPPLTAYPVGTYPPLPPPRPPPTATTIIPPPSATTITPPPTATTITPTAAATTITPTRTATTITPPPP